MPQITEPFRNPKNYSMSNQTSITNNIDLKHLKPREKHTLFSKHSSSLLHADTVDRTEALLEKHESLKTLSLKNSFKVSWNLITRTILRKFDLNYNENC